MATGLEKFRTKWASRTNITVEPVLFFYMLATFMQYSFFQDLVYEKVCRENFNETICLNLTGLENKDALDLVQTQASHWILGSTVALTVPSMIVASYLGSWSDTFGRKLPLYTPAMGMVLACIVYILMSVYDSMSVSYIILASVISGISGGFVSCIMGVMSYMSAITNDNNRSLRVAYLEAMTFVGGTIGPFIGGGIMSATQSHAIVFSVIMAAYICQILYVFFFVPEVQGTALDLTPSDVSFCSKYFNGRYFVEAFKTNLRPREDHKRLHLNLLIAAALLAMIVVAGEGDVGYLYTRDDPLDWDVSTYSFYFGMKYGVGALSLFIAMPIARHFKLHDTIVAVVGLVSRAAGLVLTGLARTTRLMFSVPFVGLFGTLCLPSIRSMSSKQVETDELGKHFAYIAIVENICTLLGSAIFNSLYPATRSFFNGFSFEFAAFLLTFPVGIMLFIRYDLHRIERRKICESREVIGNAVSCETIPDK